MTKEIINKILKVIHDLSTENSKPRADSKLNAELLRKLKDIVLSIDIKDSNKIVTGYTTPTPSGNTTHTSLDTNEIIEEDIAQDNDYVDEDEEILVLD